MKNKPSLEEVEINAIVEKSMKVYNGANAPGALKVLNSGLKKFPDSVRLKYNVAVMESEDSEKYGQKKMLRMQRATAKTLRKLLYSASGMTLNLRASMRNEYYWFSRQPRKQYALGVELVKKGRKRSYYSQGVGACELAKRYQDEGRTKLMLRWAKISQKAWENYFKVEPYWYNSYIFYARSFGFQGKFQEMEVALRKSAKIAKRPKDFYEFELIRAEFGKSESGVTRDKRGNVRSGK